MAPGSSGYADHNAKVSPFLIESLSREVEKVSQLFLSFFFQLEVKLLSRNFAESHRKCVSLEESPRAAAQRLSVGEY